MQETKSTCPYCGVGCGVIIESDGARITGVRGDPDHPANAGRLCTKGSTLHLTATESVTRRERLMVPQMRSTPEAPWQPVTWAQAIDTVAKRFCDTVKQHGPDSVGFYISGQLLTEDYYVFNKLAKGLVGTNNVDTNSRLCMSSAVVGYKQSLGADAPPACYEDLNHADCVFIAGANPAWAHPVLYRRLEDARRANPALKTIVVDPRRTETADDAQLHLAIQPGTDVMLFHGMLHAMIWENWIDQRFVDAHTEGFAALKALVRDTPPRVAAAKCGVELSALLQAAQWFSQSPRTVSLYCQGLNQSSSGTAKNTALLNLHLATGQIGRVGAGPLSLTGQPNAMGGREVGGMATLLSGHRDLANAEHRAEVARLWGVDDVPAKPGKTAVDMFEAAARGDIKALWIACTNPAQSMPDQTLVRAALARCELVVLQECFAHTATSNHAHVLLPSSTWGEKEGTVTNSERCISRVRRAVPAPGEARDDWRIVVDVARAMETRLRQPSVAGSQTTTAHASAHASTRPTLFPYESPESIWMEHRESTRGRDLDITGMSYRLLEDLGPQPWPMPEGATRGRQRLYEDGRFVTPSGRARFVAHAFQAPKDVRNASFPIALTTSRLRDQWHGMTRTGTVTRLFAHEEGPWLRMSPHDLPRRGLASGDLVTVRSRRGAVVIPLKADDRVAGGQADLAMHWGSERMSGLGVNALTTSASCPDSRQPELKHAAVTVEKAKLPWRLSAATWLDVDVDQASTMQAALQALARAWLPKLDYAACVPVAGRQGRQGWRWDAASAEPFDPTLLADLTQAMDLHGPGVAQYVDARRHRTRRLALLGQGAHARLRGLLVAGRTVEGPNARREAGEASEGAWLVELWRSEGDVAPFGRVLLSPDAQAPTGLRAKAAQVCNCFDVSQPDIEAVLRQVEGSAALRVAAVQGALRCGTQCGSCLPTLRRLEQSVSFAPASASATQAPADAPQRIRA